MNINSKKRMSLKWITGSFGDWGTPVRFVVSQGLRALEIHHKHKHKHNDKELQKE